MQTGSLCNGGYLFHLEQVRKDLSQTKRGGNAMEAGGNRQETIEVQASFLGIKGNLLGFP